MRAKLCGVEPKALRSLFLFACISYHTFLHYPPGIFNHWPWFRKHARSSPPLFLCKHCSLCLEQPPSTHPQASPRSLLKAQLPRLFSMKPVPIPPCIIGSPLFYTHTVPHLCWCLMQYPPYHDGTFDSWLAHELLKGCLSINRVSRQHRCLLNT